jgi:hypothetical protein
LALWTAVLIARQTCRWRHATCPNTSDSDRDALWVYLKVCDVNVKTGVEIKIHVIIAKRRNKMQVVK